MRFEVLGALRVCSDTREISIPRGRSSAALSWLVLNAGHAIAAESLAGVLWEQPPATAQAKTRAIVRELELVLGPGVIDRTPTGACLDADVHEIDVARFEHLAAAGRAHLVAGDPGAAREDFAQALNLWRGEPCPDLAQALPAVAALAGLVDLRLSVQEEVNALDLAGSVAYPLVAELRAQVTAHPDRPRLQRQLALALYRVDRQVEALETLRGARAELGDAEGSIDALETAILRHSPELLTGEWTA